MSSSHVNILNSAKNCIFELKHWFKHASNSITIEQKKLSILKGDVILTSNQERLIDQFIKHCKFLHTLKDIPVETIRDIYYMSYDPIRKRVHQQFNTDDRSLSERCTRQHVIDYTYFLGISNVIPLIQKEDNPYNNIHINVSFMEEDQVLSELFLDLMNLLKCLQKKKTYHGLHAKFEETLNDINSCIDNLYSLLETNSVSTLNIIHVTNHIVLHSHKLSVCMQNKITIAELDEVYDKLSTLMNHTRTILSEYVINYMLSLGDSSFMKMYRSGIHHHVLQKRYKMLQKREKKKINYSLSTKSPTSLLSGYVENNNETTQIKLCRITMWHVRNMKNNLEKYKLNHMPLPGFLVYKNASPHDMYIISAVNMSNYTYELVDIHTSVGSIVDIVGTITTYCMNQSTVRSTTADWVPFSTFTVIQDPFKYGIEDCGDLEFNDLLRIMYSGDTYITESLEDNYVEYSTSGNGDGNIPWDFSTSMIGGNFTWRHLLFAASKRVSKNMVHQDFIYLFDKHQSKFTQFFLTSIVPMSGKEYTTKQLANAYISLLELWYNGHVFMNSDCLVDPIMKMIYTNDDMRRFLGKPRTTKDNDTTMMIDDEKEQRMKHMSLLEKKKEEMLNDKSLHDYILFELEALFSQAERACKTSETEYNMILTQIDSIYESVTVYV